MDSARSSTSFFGRNQFLILRLHSLSGLLPVGAYMCVHLATNASVLAGVSTFQDNVDLIHSLGPILPLVEWAFIFLPILFHALVGVVIIQTGISNTAQYPHAGNIRYTLQRVTAWIALLFIFYHVFHLHGWFHTPGWQKLAHSLGGAQFDPHHASSTAAAALGSVAMKLVYAVGVLSCVYHFANGLWTMGITWGVWTTPAAQRRASYACGGFGLVMATIGLAALVGISRVDKDAAKIIENVRIEDRAKLQQRIDEALEAEKKAKGAATSQAASPPVGSQPAAEDSAAVQPTSR